MTSTEIKTQHFFSRSAGLEVWPVKSTRALIDGQSQVIDGPSIQFQPLGNHWGKYSTSDPAEIEFLKKRKDVVDEATYIDQTTPPAQKLATAQRQIETQNQLIADYQKQLEDLRGGASSRK